MKTLGSRLVIYGGVLIVAPLLLGLLGQGITLLFDCSGNGYALGTINCTNQIAEKIAGGLFGIGFIGSFWIGFIALPLLIIGGLMKASEWGSKDRTNPSTKTDKFATMILVIFVAIVVAIFIIPMILMSIFMTLVPLASSLGF